MEFVPNNRRSLNRLKTSHPNSLLTPDRNVVASLFLLLTV
jgi:hypothetical protein